MPEMRSAKPIRKRVLRGGPDKTDVLSALSLLYCHAEGLETHENGEEVTEEELEAARDLVQEYVFWNARA